MRRDRNRTAEVSLQRIHATNVIGMQMGNDYFSRFSSFGHHLVDTFGERLLLLFVRRTGIDDQKLLRGVNQVTAGVRRRWTSWRADRETDVVRSKRNAARRFAVRMANRQESIDERWRHAARERSQRVQRRRNCDYLIAQPALVCIARFDPFAV